MISSVGWGYREANRIVKIIGGRDVEGMVRLWVGMLTLLLIIIRCWLLVLSSNSM